MVEIVPMLLRHLALPVSKDPNKPVLPSSSQNWKSLRNIVKIYLTDMIQVIIFFSFVFQLLFFYPLS